MSRGPQLQRRARALVDVQVRGHAQLPERAAHSEQGLVDEIHANLGNADVATLVAQGPGDAAGLYLSDLLAASARTGQDFAAYLPWRAPAAWTTFARAWYRVLWAERERAGLVGIGPAEAGAAVDAAAMGAPTMDAPTVDAPALDAPATDVATPFAADALAADTFAPDLSAEVGADAVARAARGPDVGDRASMDAWFSRLESGSGSGRQLTQEERGFLEEVHGRPVPDARIHEDAFAKQMAGEIDARAFTVGNEVWMGEDRPLSDPRGAELLAHEIAHVIQNALGRGGNGGKPVSSPGDAHEREAEARGRDAAAMVARGEWAFEAPEGLDPAGRMLAAWIEGQLPATAPEAPEALVLDGLRELLVRRAEGRIAAAAAQLRDVDGPEARAALGRLDGARAAVAAAGSDRASLAALVSLAGAPSVGDLQGLQAGFAPYPSFAAQAEATLRDLAGPDPVAALVAATVPLEVDEAPAARVGTVRDVDPARALQTAALIDRLASALRISGEIPVRADADAADRLAEIGTRGLYEGGEILLDPSRYDPSTTDGRALLAHEVVHVAQEALPVADAPFAGTLAEAEATIAADRFAGGVAVQPLAMGLPDGHVAAESPVGAADLEAYLDAYEAQSTASRGGMVTPGTVNNNAKDSASQNRQKKLSEYKNGVDGIAEMIEDLDAFDDLCDSVDEAEDAEEANAGKKEGEKTAPPAKADTNGPMARIKASDPYKDLCRMWQSAKDGGEDAGEMQAAFNNEFDGRGFWGSTEKAFDLVEANAKADAKPEPSAQAAKNDALAAEDKAKGADKTTKGDKGGKTDVGEKGGGLAVGQANADMAALMAATVEAEPARIDSFEQMKGVTDADLEGLLGKVNEHQGFAKAASAPGASDRTSQILGTLKDNFLGTAVSSFTDQFVDSLVWDTLGGLGDKALNALTKGKLGGGGAPMIGPLLGLGKEVYGAWGPNGFDAGKFAGSALGGDKFGSSLDSFGNIGNTLGNLNKAHSAKDVLGILFAAGADFFQGLRDLCDGLASLCGTLSALCYIVGGVLILVGIATAWLGWGVGLISAGGWLIKAGGILARINTALGLLVIFLSGVVTFFRTIAAFCVPASMYASQLQGVGDAAGNFGEKAGAWAGDKTANKVKDGLSRNKADDAAPEKKPGGEQDGADTHKKADDAIEAKNKELEAVNKDLEAEKKKLAEQEAADKPKDEGDDGKKKADDDGADAVKTPVRQRVLKALDRLTRASELKRGVDELIDHVKNVKTNREQATAEALQPSVRDAVVANLDKKLQTQLDNVKKLNADLDEAREKGLPADDVKAIQDKIKKAQDDIDAGRPKLEKLKVEVEKAKAMEAEMAKSAAVADENEQRKKDGKKPLKDPMDLEIDQNRKKVDAAKKEHDDRQRDLDDAKAQADKRTAELERRAQKAADDAKALRDDVGDPEQAKKDIDAHNQKHLDDQKKKADAILDDMGKLTREADDLNKKASDAEKAKALRETAAQAEARRVEVERKAQAALNSLEQHVGKTVVLNRNAGGGRRTQDAHLHAVEADGLVVSDGKGGTKKVPFSEVFGPQNLKAAAVRADDAKKTLSALENDAAKAKEADKLAPADADPTALRQEADEKRKQAAAMQDDWQGTQNPTAAPTHPKQEKLDQAGKLDGEAADLKRQLDQLESDVDEKSKKADDARKDLAAAEAELKASEAKKQKAEDLGHTHNYLREGTSGNATGGIGSSYKFWAEGVFRVLYSFEEVAKAYKESGTKAAAIKVLELGKEPGEGEDRPKSPGTLLSDKVLGLQGRSKDALGSIGEKQAAIERLLDLTVPVDVGAMKEKRKKAAEAHVKYEAAHADAYKAYQAELIVEKHSQQTKALAKAGKPIQDASASMQGPLQSSQADENARQSKIGGANKDAPASEGGANGIVAELVMKLAKHSDAMDDQPNGGDKDAGNKVEEGQKRGKDDTKKNVDDAQKLSEEQRAFLDQAIAKRQEQEDYVRTNISSLDTKYEEEQAIKAEIQTMKAQSLADRERYRAEVEENASGFNGDVEQLKAWSVDYDSRVKGLDEATGK